MVESSSQSGNPGNHFGSRVRTTCASAFCFVLFWWAGAFFHIPARPADSPSLLSHDRPIPSVLVVIVTTIVAMLVASILVGPRRRYSALFATAVGLSALSMRGGTVSYLITSASGPAIFLKLLFETIMLIAIILLAWQIAELLIPTRGLDEAERIDDSEPFEQTHHKILAFLSHALLMTVVTWIVAQSDRKAQVLAAAGIGGYIAAVGAHYVFPTGRGVWFWPATALVAVAGYTMAYFQPGDWQIGQFAQPLARLLPLDYASAGVAGSVLGFQTMRGMKHDQDAENASQSPAGSSTTSTG